MGALTRRAALAALGAGGGAAVFGYLLRGVVKWPIPEVRLADHDGCMGVGHADMMRYAEMFRRHTEIARSVDEIPGGVRTTTRSSAPDLVAQLQAHVSSMYARLDQGTEVMCASASLPTLFRRAGGYRRVMTLTPDGVITEETSDDPALTDAIRAHAQEVTGFVRDGMPAAMRGMMGCDTMGPGMMGPGMMNR
ncbi:hypothetical protein MSAS_27140 [Mycobacterium saskatchewanense]|uniref:Uncharacterized protein n=1 Tax=Mycobacterium saskatchewanense TaxID=220927 RepID=A0AAJ3NQS6_9MYCO|nr:hypothetical protein [Mycobacterium saskatchewanense]ORW71667.1 hypothetical protein AWC23_12900 [Mycobacterium saskatchewanense]BBX63540.1 hypothetical protein MSAS_27140 [Mycobacterium saskatchewanense]